MKRRFEPTTFCSSNSSTQYTNCLPTLPLVRTIGKNLGQKDRQYLNMKGQSSTQRVRFLGFLAN